MSRVSATQDDEEARKRITAIAHAGVQTVMFDNVAGLFGGPSLEAAITAERWSDRVLGSSAIIDLPVTIVWCATGNNVELTSDMSRRVAHIRLNSKLEQPESRRDFQHPDLLEWVRENRARLLAAALTIFRGYFAAGQPSQGLTPWGSFEGWAVIRNAIVWAGLSDPELTRQELATRADGERNALAALHSRFQQLDPEGEGISCSVLIERLKGDAAGANPLLHALREAIAELDLMTGNGLPTAGSLGRKLGNLKERPVNGRCLDSRRHNNTSLWFVRELSLAASCRADSKGLTHVEIPLMNSLKPTCDAAELMTPVLTTFRDGCDSRPGDRPGPRRRVILTSSQFHARFPHPPKGKGPGPDER